MNARETDLPGALISFAQTLFAENLSAVGTMFLDAITIINYAVVPRMKVT